MTHELQVFCTVGPGLLLYLGVLWPLRFLAHHLSGERARVEGAPRKPPVLPDYVIVLRKAGPGDAEVEGGGLL